MNHCGRMVIFLCYLHEMNFSGRIARLRISLCARSVILKTISEHGI